MTSAATESIVEFRLPDAGEGLTEAEILKWHVAPGDVVEVNQTIVEIETAKAAVELPCPYAGTIRELLVPEGVVVPVGTPIITIATAAPPAAFATPAPTAADARDEGALEGASGPESSPAPAQTTVEPAREAVLVGYGVRQTGEPKRRARTSSASPHGTVTPETGPPGETVKPVRHGGLELGRIAEERLGSVDAEVLAKPPVRRLAKDLGIDLRAVDATGPAGVITRTDVERAARLASDPVGKVPDTHGPQGHLHGGEVGERDIGAEVRTPLRGVTRVMAEAMVRSAFSAPHVTEWVDVDVTRAVKLTRRLRESDEFAALRISPMLLIAVGLIRAVRRNPAINASLDTAAQEIVTKRDINLGIAAATPRGLVVPNVKRAQDLSTLELASALRALTDQARAGKTSPADMLGGTITITNVGVFGIDGGTPIINLGESAILAVGRIIKRPWVHKGKVKPRDVMELALSFDHRIIDGALGSRVLADVANFLNDPELSLTTE